jgi:hypothetical protein
VAFFSDTQAALADGRTVRYAELTVFEFEEATAYLWDGVGDLELDGVTYQSNKGLVARSAIGFGENDDATEMSHTLSGVDPTFVDLARQSASVRGRPVTVFGQFFDEDWVPLDSKFFIAKRVMDVLRYSAQGPQKRSISVSEETIWTNRNGAAFAFYSDADQQARFPGDLGCSFTAGLQDKKIGWPQF